MSNKIEFNIQQWDAISDTYLGGSLVLANGSSIAIDNRFRYPSLYEAATESGFISPEVTEVFESLDAAGDFEFVLRNLAIAKDICTRLSITFSEEDEEKLTNSYNQVREALVQTVRTVHPENADVLDRFQSMANFMKGFRTVVSLNYDLLIYWAIMWSRENDNSHQFKDCFRGDRTFEFDFEEYREPYNSPDLNADDVTLIFYPHGNLILAKLETSEVKLVAGANNLLENILSKWEDYQHTPLFVCEGMSDRKMKSIENSVYLRTVYDRVLKNLSKRIVIYGWNIGPQDNHLLEAIAKSNPERIAVSIYDENQIQAIKQTIESRIENVEIDFFASNSQNCWIY